MLDIVEYDSFFIGDKAYGSKPIREWISSQGGTCTITPRENAKKPWKADWCLYKERHLVECYFDKIKHFRRVAARYDKLANSFLELIYVVGIFKLTL